MLVDKLSDRLCFAFENQALRRSDVIREELMSLLGRDADLTVRTAGVRDGLLWSEAFPVSWPAVRA